MRPLRLLAHSAVVLALAAVAACSGKSNKDGNNSDRYGNYTLFDTRYDQVNLGKAKDNAADVLTKLEGKDNIALIGLWAYNPPQILNAVKDADKLGKTHIIGFDEYDDTLQGIKDGHIHATVVQNPFVFGYESVKLLAKLARDPKANLPAEVKDGVWNVPHRVIRKKDVDSFWSKLRDLKEQAKGADPEGDITIAFVSNNAEEFWTFAHAGALVAARESKVKLIFKKPQDGTVDVQTQAIRDLLDKVQGIAVSVNDPKNQKEFLDEVGAKIPLITVDNDAPDTKRRCYIGTDNIAAGREVGKLVKEVMSEGTIAIFVGKPDPLNAQQRRQGVLDELAGK